MADVTQSVRESAKQVLQSQHQTMREIVQGLDAEALNWVPGSEMNSITVLLIHSLGSEENSVGTVVGEPVDRNRDAEFLASVSSADDLLKRIDDVDAKSVAWIDRITDEDLSSLRSPVNGPADRNRLGIRWLFGVVEHNREHVGQALLTRQLYEQRG